MHDFRQIRQYLMGAVAILVANALVGNRLDYCDSLFRSLSSFNIRKCSVFKTHLVGLSQTAIDTYGHLQFLNNSIGCQLSFAVFLNLPVWFISFFTLVISAVSVLFFLFIVEDMAQDITVQIKGSWRFLNTIHLYMNKKKHDGHSFAFDPATVWNDLPDDLCSAQLFLF